jgi:hypothetical protein
MLLNHFTPQRLLATFMVFASLMLASAPSEAVPAFARQTGKACSSCHFQHYPTLNDFGMDFKAGGYVDIKNRPILGNDLSLADSLYASVFTKLRYQKTNGTDGVDGAGLQLKSTHSGEWQIPDEFALLLGGRVGKNIGFLIEGNLNSGGDSVLAGFKIPAMYEVGDGGMKAGVVPFSTDALGASYGFELLSTGAVRNIRVSEHRNETSAQQYVFFNNAGAAAGAAFVLYDPRFHVAFTPYTPNHLPGGGSNLGGLNAKYFRAAVTPNIAGWALAAGVQSWSGSSVRTDTGGGVIGLVSTKGWAIDAQAQGAVAGLPLGVYFAHAKAPGSAAGSTTPNLFNANPNARTATTVTAELGLLPNKATVLAGYRRADNGALTNSGDNAFSLGATYQIYQNVQLQVVHSRRQKAGGVGRYGPGAAAGVGTLPGTSLTTFMLSAGY